MTAEQETSRAKAREAGVGRPSRAESGWHRGVAGHRPGVLTVADEFKTVAIWNGAIAYQRPAPKGPPTAVDIGLEEFGRHRDRLLAILRDGYERGHKSAPIDAAGAKAFDADRAWRLHLEGLAHQYFSRESVKQTVTKPADRRAMLRDIARALARSRDAIDRATRSDVGEDLIAGWWKSTSECGEAEGRFVDLLHIEREFDKVTKCLAVVEAAAVRAADDVPKTLGRLRGTAILPRDFIEALAAVYRDATGSKPGAGGGPFAKFVLEFLTALGRCNIEYETVIEAIKDARRWALDRQETTNWGPSPFDEEFGTKE